MPASLKESATVYCKPLQSFSQQTTTAAAADSSFPPIPQQLSFRPQYPQRLAFAPHPFAPGTFSQISGDSHMYLIVSTQVTSPPRIKSTFYSHIFLPFFSSFFTLFTLVFLHLQFSPKILHSNLIRSPLEKVVHQESKTLN